MLKRLASPYVLLTLTLLFWTGNTTVARGFADDVPPMALSFWRWAIALLILLPFAGRGMWAARRVILANWRIMVFLSVLSVSAYNSLLYLGLQHTTVINASLVGASVPVLIVALSFILFRTKISWLQGVGIALSLSGVLIIIAKGDLSRLGAVGLNPGDLLVLVANLAWAFYSVLLPKKPAELGGLVFLTATVAIGLLFIAPLYALEWVGGARLALDTPNLLVLGYVGIFPSVLAYIFWNRGVMEVGANTAGQFIYLSPAFGAAMGMAFLGEALFPYHGAGIALIFAGIWLAVRRGAKR